nr:unnamed protein product [Digitaria exilis]
METAAARKEWRAVPDAPLRSNGAEDAAEHGKLGQPEDRAIYEEGAGGMDGFCAITIDGTGGLSEDILQQRLQSVVRQREELQQVEIDLRAQAIAHPQIIQVQQTYQAAVKEKAAAAAKLKDQLHEREQYILELEMKLNDKDRELNALKIDHQTVWANQDLLREQTKELATVRRERDNSEAERAQHLKQIHDLQEHLREKESQFIALEEQHRVAQENILYKDEQLREAHAWVSQVREMDALQSQSLQVELRERMEQFNQYWISSQQQYAEMQRGFLHTIQQLQLELNEARERSGAQKDVPQVSREGSAESSFVQSIVNSVASNGSATADGNQQLKNNGSVDVSVKKVFEICVTFINFQGNSASAVPVPSSLLGIGGYAPSAHITGLHSYMIHQGIPQPLASPNSGVPQFGSFQSQSATQPNLHWANQQEVQTVSQPQDEPTYQPSQSDQTALRPDVINPDELSSKPSQACQPDNLNAHGKQQQNPASVPAESTHELAKTSQVVESNVAEHVVYDEQQRAFKEQDPPSIVNIRAGMVEHQEQNTEPKLPNRLGKMLAPLHWHDYKKQYGKLDDFVASHPELFVIEGDLIHLCEGAQQLISASTAAAKIAAAKSSAPHSSLLPSVAVTPVAQSTRQKRGSAVDSRSSNAIPSGNGLEQFNIIQGVSDVTISGKVRNTQDNGFSDEVRSGQPSMHTAAVNGVRHDKAASNIRHGYGGKQQGRSTDAAYISRR